MRGPVCANRGQGEVKVQLALMGGGGDRVVRGPEYGFNGGYSCGGV